MMWVWNAMPSITLMMSEIFFGLSLMPFMVSTTWTTTSPPLIATVLALWASQGWSRPKRCSPSGESPSSLQFAQLDVGQRLGAVGVRARGGAG